METHERTLRKLQKCLYIYIGETARGDLGMFAAKSFRSGETIMADEDGDYYDNVCSHQDIIKSGYGYERTLQVGINAFKLPNGSIDDFTNHSCEPSTGIRLTPKGTVILAIGDIEPHDELTYDYSTYINNPHERMNCSCGAATCRRLIGSFKTLPTGLQRTYRRLGIVGNFVDETWREPAKQEEAVLV
ncbi:MAG: SET domain-containing protein-lysine N-methyltransferase [Geminicoccaceae bacterium]